MCEELCVVLYNFLQSDEESLPKSERRYCPTGLVDQGKPDGQIFPIAWRKCIDLQSLQRLVSNNSTRKA